MVASAEVDILADGIYTQTQAAHLARLHPQTVARWLEDSPRYGAAIRRHMPQNEKGVVSFVDLIQLFAVRAIRFTRTVSLQKIREATHRAEQMGITFPLARDIKIYLLGDTVVLGLPNGSMVEATGKHAKNYVIQPVVLPYLEDITFDAASGLAQEYRPSTAAGIVLNPTRQWGAPIVDRCDYSVETLVSAVGSEGSVEAAAAMCQVTPEDVRAALRYEDVLRGVL